MCSSVKILDCTLREAPIEGLMWGDFFIKNTVKGLENSGVDIIEIGFLKNSKHAEGSTSFQRVEEIEQYIAPKKEGTLYVALVDYGRYDLQYLSPWNGNSIDAIRICFKHDEIEKVLSYAQQIRDLGYKVCIQHVDTLGYTDGEVLAFLEQVNNFKPFAYSIVDTFGAMYQDDMLHYARLVDEKLDKEIYFGFHGHNNLMLADANGQCFVNEIGNHRNIIVDTSLYGCGRSAGNAHTELITQFMNVKHGKNYNINEILDLMDVVIAATKEKTTWGYSIPYFIAGMHNAHTFNVKQLLKRHNLKSKDLRGIIEKLDDKQKKEYDYALLEKLYVEYFNHPLDDSIQLQNLRNKLCKRSVLIIAPGKTAFSEKESILTYINRYNPIVIGVNDIIPGYRFDYVFYSSAVRYQNLQYQCYKAAGSPEILLTSNIKTNVEQNEVCFDYTSLIKFGWVNIDSAAILLLRLLIKCGINHIAIAGMDGYKESENSFYDKNLDANLSLKDRIICNQENSSMIRDLINYNPELILEFITQSEYRDSSSGGHDD